MTTPLATRTLALTLLCSSCSIVDTVERTLGLDAPLELSFGVADPAQVPKILEQLQQFDQIRVTAERLETGILGIRVLGLYLDIQRAFTELAVDALFALAATSDVGQALLDAARLAVG